MRSSAKKKDKITTLYSPQSITFSDQKSFKFPLSCNTSVDFSRRLGLAIPHQTFYQSDFVHRNVKHIDIDFPWKQSHWTRKKIPLDIYRRPSRALRRGKMNESPDIYGYMNTLYDLKSFLYTMKENWDYFLKVFFQNPRRTLDVLCVLNVFLFG